MRNVCKVLIVSPKQKWLLVRPRCQWDDNIKGGRVVCDNVYWIHLTQDENQWQVFVNAIMNFWFALKTDLD